MPYQEYQRLIERNRELEAELVTLKQSLNSSKTGDLIKDASSLADGTKIITGIFEGATPAQLREVADDIRSRVNSAAIALAAVNETKAILLIAMTENLNSKFHAGNLMKDVAQIAGSKGGGKADIAQAGGGDPHKVKEALKRFEELVQ